jgi:outer membrane protein TolC
MLAGHDWNRSSSHPRILAGVLLLLQTVVCSGTPVVLSIEQALYRAGRFHPELTTLRIESHKTAYELLRLRLGYLPRIRIGVSGSDTVRYYEPDSRSRRSFVSVRTVLFDGGSGIREHGMLREKERLDSLFLSHRTQEIMITTVDAYIKLLRNRTHQEIQETLIERAQMQVQTAEKQAAIGLLTQNDLLRIQLASHRASLELSGLQIEETALQKQLAGMVGATGYQDNTRIIVTGKIDPDYKGILNPDSTSPADEAVHRSLMVLSSIFAVTEAEAAYREFLFRAAPRIHLDAEIFSQGQAFPTHEHGGRVGIEIRIPLPGIGIGGSVSAETTSFDTRTRSFGAFLEPGSDLEAFHAHNLNGMVLEQTAVDMKRIQSLAHHEATQQLARIRRLHDKLHTVRLSREISHRQIEITRVQHEKGLTTGHTLLTAEAEHARLESELVTTVTELHQEEMRLLLHGGQLPSHSEMTAIILPEES